MNFQSRIDQSAGRSLNDLGEIFVRLVGFVVHLLQSDNPSR